MANTVVFVKFTSECIPLKRVHKFYITFFYIRLSALSKFESLDYLPQKQIRVVPDLSVWFVFRVRRLRRFVFEIKRE